MQLDFEQNWSSLGPDAIPFTIGTLNMVPIYINDSISWQTINVGLSVFAGTVGSFSLSVGLYSLTGSTLTLLNSASGSIVGIANSRRGYIAASVTSASSNISGGQYWLGLLPNTGGTGTWSYCGVANMAQGTSSITAQWPSFVQGRLTSVSTNALPTSLLVSDLDQTGISMASPTILLTA